jgi:hypothetical protein
LPPGEVPDYQEMSSLAAFQLQTIGLLVRAIPVERDRIAAILARQRDAAPNRR